MSDDRQQKITDSLDRYVEARRERSEEAARREKAAQRVAVSSVGASEQKAGVEVWAPMASREHDRKGYMVQVCVWVPDTVVDRELEGETT